MEDKKPVPVKDQKGISNKPSHRSISDTLDKVMGWEGGYKETSKPRAIIHTIYHDAVGYYKSLHGNKEGAAAEHQRAKDIWDKSFKD